MREEGVVGCLAAAVVVRVALGVLGVLVCFVALPCFLTVVGRSGLEVACLREEPGMGATVVLVTTLLDLVIRILLSIITFDRTQHDLPSGCCYLHLEREKERGRKQIWVCVKRKDREG